MRLVRLKLRDYSQFWIMPPISLHGGQETSPLINIDKLDRIQQEIINESVRKQKITLIDQNGNKVNGNLESMKRQLGKPVDLEDIEIDKEMIPELVSVTIEEEEDPEPEEEIVIEPKHLEEATILLKRNRQTARKTISNLDPTNENRILLHACLQKETENKNRSKVIEAIHNKLEEY